MYKNFQDNSTFVKKTKITIFDIAITYIYYNT